MSIYPDPVSDELEERPVTFPSRGKPSFQLEGILHSPRRTAAGTGQHAGDRTTNAPVIVLCHPQPASSDMQESLTTLLARNLAQSDMLALRFNFRGVGKSQGKQSDGRFEPLDLAGAIDCALAQPGANPAKVCVIGHSFGAYIALLYAPFDPRIRTLVAVSLPLHRAAGGFPKAFERPKLFVTGEFDEICPLYKLEPFVEQLKGPKGIKVVVGARHLMRGYEDAAIETVVKYVRNWASMPGV
jgi:alpha/beta superfamily hydrolase